MGEFEVRDKRTMDAQGNPKMDAQGNPKAEAARAQQQARSRQTPAEGPSEAALPPAGESNFLSFLVNLAAMAYMALGLGETPTEPNLPEAKYIIDSIDMLGAKTKGNLTPEEENGLGNIIYELKVNFSKVALGGARK